MLVLNMVTEKLQILVPDCFEHGDHKDNTRQLALRLASLGCLVVCIDRDGDTNQTTVNDIQVKPISEFQKTFFKTWLCPPGGWRYSLGISMRCEQEWRGGSDGEVRFFGKVRWVLDCLYFSILPFMGIYASGNAHIWAICQRKRGCSDDKVIPDLLYLSSCPDARGKDATDVVTLTF